MNNVAVTYCTAGRYKDTLPLHEQVLTMRVRVLDGDYPDTLASMRNLAATCHALGQYERALKV